MQVMDTATLDELRALRARAYGPSADIHQDPAAVRRLHELEAGRKPLRSPDAEQPAAAADVAKPPTKPAPPASPLQAERAREPETQSDAVQTSTSTDVFGALESAVVRRGREGRAAGVSPMMRLTWAVSVVAAAALAASATYVLTWIAPVSVSSGAEQIATLEPVPMVDLPPGWFGAGPSSMAFEFYGMTLFETADGFTASGGTDCFVIVPTEELPAADADTANWSMSGAVHTGCGVGDFPATIELPVDSNTPEELRSSFPEGSALQFVRDGDRIGVFLDTP
ncbi:hypothetical protein B2K11_00380 [Microbacterium sp. B35-30]|nr:hypothetical protein B2K11_00380 [Microbacterium sp. B35-30]